MTRRALVTGAHGFVGRHLVAWLSSTGWEVHGIDRGSSPGGRGPASSIVDVRDRSGLDAVVAGFRPSHVFHLAAVLGHADLEPLFAVNVAGTACVIDALRAHAPRARLVVTSSSAVYGAQPDRPISETAPLQPASAYAASKAAQEMVAQAARLNGMDVVRVRPFNLVGPGQPDSQVTSAIARQIAAAECRGGGQVRIGTTTTRRDYVDVRDVVQAYAAVAVLEGAGDLYNVCSERSIAIQESLDRMVAMARVPIDVVRDPALVRANDIPAQVGSASRIREATGWRPAIALEQSLRDLLEDARRRAAEHP